MEALDALDGLIRYYRTNAHRMRYAAFREAGFSIGSGAAESAHRHVLQTAEEQDSQASRYQPKREPPALSPGKQGHPRKDRQQAPPQRIHVLDGAV